MDRRLFLTTTTAAAALAATGTATPAAAAGRTTATTGTAAAPTGTDTGRLLQALLAAEHAAGMLGVFAEVRDGRQRWQPAAGVADVDTARPMRATLRHRVGSITKTFVATTVLQFAGERRLRLDAPIGTVLPGVLPAGQGRDITVRMLLNHTSGLGNYTQTLLGSPEAVLDTRVRTFTPDELIETGLALPVTNAPGAAWSYSNTNYIVLGLLIERLTGHRYGDEIRRRILRPLGMRDTYFPGNRPEIRGPHSRAYVEWVDGELRDFTEYNMSAAWAAGELISTATDLNRFFGALLTGRLLRPQLLAEMRRTVPFDPADPPVGGYGLGLMWVPTPCGRAWGHDGGTVGHTTVSLHGENGRQVTLAENEISLLPGGPIDPVAEARQRFVDAALCGPRRGARTLAAARTPLVDTPAFAR